MSVHDLSHKKESLWEQFHAHFKTDTNEVIINDDLTIDVVGSVYLRTRPLPEGKIPVKFGKVDSFFVDHSGITTFENSPRFIGGSAWFQGNPISDWTHAPEHVSMYLGIAATNLWNLTGLPQGVRILACNYAEDMPLLRALQVKEVSFPYVNAPAPQEFVQIINDPRWMGQGKRMMLHCALALKNAGFDGNAKW